MLITYINCCQKLCKTALRYQAEALDLMLWIEHVRRTKQEMVSEAQTRALNAPRYYKKTRNGSRGINSCIKCASNPVFATCQVRLRNDMEPPKT